MSLLRLIIWSSLLGGWAAFAGWLITELPFHAWIDDVNSRGLAAAMTIAMATLVATAIGGGISVASGLTNPQVANLIKRLLIGIAGGLVAGLIGSLIGSGIHYVVENIALSLNKPAILTISGVITRMIGWILIGLGVGAAEGILDRNLNKIRNGLIGGAVGGFLAGVFFIPVSVIVGSPMSSRAFAFVLLGLAIGLFIGLAQVILKEAWLTVEAGFRPGRQMILGNDLITMGTSEKSSIIFIAFGAKGVEPTHLRITKQPDGRYVLEDNQSRSGTLLNGQPVQGPTPLADGDTIQLGVNVVRFNERGKHERVPPPVMTKEAPKPAIAAQAVTAKAPVAAPAKPAVAPPPKPAVAAKPAAPVKPAEAPCPSCGKKVVGLPGQRFCKSCFQTF